MNPAILRLIEERKAWRKNHPFGFNARPSPNEDGPLKIMVWECTIPGKIGTKWNGPFKLEMKFSDDYPSNPPLVKFLPPIKHPNVFASGIVCLPMLDADTDWKPSLSIGEILKGVHSMLGNPIIESAVNIEALAIHLQYEKLKKKTAAQADKQ